MYVYMYDIITCYIYIDEKAKVDLSQLIDNLYELRIFINEDHFTADVLEKMQQIFAKYGILYEIKSSLAIGSVNFVLKNVLGLIPNGAEDAIFDIKILNQFVWIMTDLQCIHSMYRNCYNQQMKLIKNLFGENYKIFTVICKTDPSNKEMVYDIMIKRAIQHNNQFVCVDDSTTMIKSIVVHAKKIYENIDNVKNINIMDCRRSLFDPVHPWICTARMLSGMVNIKTSIEITKKFNNLQEIFNEYEKMKSVEDRKMLFHALKLCDKQSSIKLWTELYGAQ